MTKGTVIRTALLLLAIINNALAIFGKSPLPIDDAMLTEVISFGFTVGSAIAAWWMNNDFTPEAVEGTKLTKELKIAKKAGL